MGDEGGASKLTGLNKRSTTYKKQEIYQIEGRHTLGEDLYRLGQAPPDLARKPFLENLIAGSYMKINSGTFMFLLFGTPVFVYEGQPDAEPVVILYNDSTGTHEPNDITTQLLPNHIIYHMMHVVLPKKYGIYIELTPHKGV